MSIVNTCRWRGRSIVGGASILSDTAKNLGDATMQKYDYANVGSGANPRPTAPSAALAPYLGTQCRSDTEPNVETDIKTGPIFDYFSCPSDELLPVQASNSPLTDIW